MDKIISSQEFGNKYSKISKLCRDTKQPIYITVDDHVDTVLIDINEYNKMKAELELLRELSFAEEEVRNNKLSLINDTFNKMRQIIN